jgi:hypothetical protein
VPTTTEPPPTSIIVEEHCKVTTYQNLGTRDTGLGKTGEGYRYTCKTSPGASFTVTCSPDALNDGNAVQAAASVQYDATTIPAPQVTVSPKTNGLAWDSTNHVQLAAYTCTVDVSALKSAGWQGWTFAWDSGGDGTSGTLQMGSATTSQTCAGSAHGPGTFTSANCTVTATAPDGTHMNVVANADDCAALGGVIKFDVQSTPVPTWSHDLDDQTKPYYLQHFYAHDAVPTTTTAQLQQLGKVSAPKQPTGTQITWTIPSFLYTPGLSNGTVKTTGGDTPLVLSADSASLGAITCQFDLTWTDPMHPDNTYTFSVADDTATSQQLVGGAWVPMVNQFHAHTPSSVTEDSPPLIAPSYPKGGCAGERDYTLVLFDSDGAAMQDVWVNERWDPQPDSTITVNGIGEFWITQEPSPGQFSRLDHIAYVWSPPPPWDGWTVSHFYWAASKEVAHGSTEGFLVGTFTTHWTPGDPNNDPTPADCGQQ